MLTDSLRLTPREASAANDGLPRRLRSLRGPDLSLSGSDAFTHRQKVDLAEQILRNLSLVQDWAPLVVLCGHTADVVNNPYRAALDCGACGGHSGEPNARVAAAILNDVAVRQDLAERGMALPPGTWFLSAVHHTTTDVIRFLDTDAIPASHRERWRRLQVWTEQAGELSRAERVQRMGNVPADDMRRRSRDWAEVRPEWGLAGNAAFIAAPRTRTAGLNLEGRTFMHSYDHRLDPHGKVLELILTAPLVVANWINLQYYASTVDNRAFGSGNKVMHNVVGLMGVLQGNGGDLMTGLPWQSVHDGRQLQHEPLRLLAVVEAPREKVRQILDKHSAVRALGSNGWLSLVVLEAGRFYRWTLSDRWIEIDVP